MTLVRYKLLRAEDYYQESWVPGWVLDNLYCHQFKWHSANGQGSNWMQFPGNSPIVSAFMLGSVRKAQPDAYFSDTISEPEMAL